MEREPICSNNTTSNNTNIRIAWYHIPSNSVRCEDSSRCVGLKSATTTLSMFSSGEIYASYGSFYIEIITHMCVQLQENNSNDTPVSSTSSRGIFKAPLTGARKKGVFQARVLPYTLRYNSVILACIPQHNIKCTCVACRFSQ